MQQRQIVVLGVLPGELAFATSSCSGNGEPLQWLVILLRLSPEMGHPPHQATHPATAGVSFADQQTLVTIGLILDTQTG